MSSRGWRLHRVLASSQGGPFKRTIPSYSHSLKTICILSVLANSWQGHKSLKRNFTAKFRRQRRTTRRLQTHSQTVSSSGWASSSGRERSPRNRCYPSCERHTTHYRLFRKLPLLGLGCCSGAGSTGNFQGESKKVLGPVRGIQGIAVVNDVERGLG